MNSTGARREGLGLAKAAVTSCRTVAVRRKEGWMVGEHGPYRRIRRAIQASDADVVIADKPDHTADVIVNGTMRGSYLWFDQINGSGRPLTLVCRRPHPESRPGDGREHRFVVNSTTVHGPYERITYHHTVAEGLLSLRGGAHGDLETYVYYDGRMHGPFRSVVDEHSHSNGTKYLICAHFDSPQGLKTLFGSRGLLGNFILNLHGNGCITGIGTTPDGRPELAIIHDGGVVARHAEAASAFTYPVGRDVIQVVRWDGDDARDTVYCNALPVAGPFAAFDDFVLDASRGVFTFTAYDKCDDGTERCRSVMGTYRD